MPVSATPKISATLLKIAIFLAHTSFYRDTDSGEGEPSTDEYRKVTSAVGKALGVLKGYARGYSGTVPRTTSEK